jgi:hypothetical protein
MAEMNRDGSGGGIELGGHATGNPFPGGGMGFEANVSVGHTWLIIALALILLWLFGAGFFRKIRM